MIAQLLDWPTAPTAPAPAGARCAVDVEVANLTVEERDVLRSVIAVLSDPGLAGLRRDLMTGRVCLVVEDGEVTWASVVEGGGM